MAQKQTTSTIKGKPSGRRRQLHDLPLKDVRNRLPERWRKWCRRRPLGLPLIVLVVCFCATASVAGFNYSQANAERLQQAETALTDGQELQRKGQHEAAVHRFLAGKELAEQSHGSSLLQTQLDLRLHQAQRLQKAAELSNAVHLMRFYALQDHTPRRMQHVLEAVGRKLWAERGLLTESSAGKLDLATEKSIHAELQELILLWSDLQVRLAPPTHTQRIRREVRMVMTEAEPMFGPPLELTREQPEGLAHRSRHPQEAWEFCTLGRIALANGKYADATDFIQQALDREPLAFVPNFYLGVSALRQKKYEQALQAFSFCAGQKPCAECFLLRGQTQAALGDNERALKDFNLAIEKNPELAIAYQLRGSVYREMGRIEEAAKDFGCARRMVD